MEDVMIIKRNDEVVEFNTEKIIAAIQRVFEELAENLKEMVDNIFTALHEFAHMMLHFFSVRIGKRRRRRVVLSYLLIAPPISAMNYRRTYSLDVLVNFLHSIMTHRWQVGSDADDANSNSYKVTVVCV